VFRIVQDNLAQTDPDASHIIPGSSPPTRASIAAKGATSKGFELEVIGKPARELERQLGYSRFQMRDAADARVNTDFPRQLIKLFTTYRLPGAMERPGRRRRRQLAEQGLFGLDQSSHRRALRFEQKSTPWSA
jgi:outer membrane receptor for ferric coprogen and ferric-rhodotorulic acid